MRELAAVGLSKDGQYLIARDPASGVEFQIRADDRLTAAATTNRARRDPLEKKMESSLTPREIQARIRRGESPDTVADAAGVDTNHIIGYAVPVLAEREHMCERARGTVIRRKHVAGTGFQLGNLVDDHLLSSGGSPANAQWDSWRREDGRWTLQITPLDAIEPATFIFDIQGRYVIPDNEPARTLVGDLPAADPSDMAIADAIRTEKSAAPGEVEPAPSEAHPEGVSSLKAARDRRAMEQLALNEELDFSVQLDDEVDGVPEEEVSAPEAEQTSDHDVAVPDVVSSPMPRKRRERRRVPSWDEIMFGGKTDS